MSSAFYNETIVQRLDAIFDLLVKILRQLEKQEKEREK
nr:MAG TPA: hypothetical protein [Caudoviricetes sp.]